VAMSFAQEMIIANACAEQESIKSESRAPAMKSWAAKAVRFLDMQDIDDDEQTTDFGLSEASETESSSGVSGNEAGRSFTKRCRFGKTALETIPGTPAAGASLQMMSPPGLSRATMRQARDCATTVDAGAAACGKSLCRFGTTPFNTVPKTPTGGSTSQLSPPGLSRAAMRQARDACHPAVEPMTADASESASTRLCRFGQTALDTVPKTPVGAAKLKALKDKLGSPPGLSRADMRKERDACKGADLRPTSWRSAAEASPAAPPLFQPPVRAAKTMLSKIKQEAARLKELKMQRELDNSEEDLDASQESSSDEEDKIQIRSTTQDKRCRFDVTSLGTVPSTPVGEQAAVPSTPVGGLSRAAMRQARDARKSEAAIAGSWKSCTGQPIAPAAR